MPRAGGADFALDGEGQVRKESIVALNASLRHEEEVQHHIENSNLAAHEVALYILQNGSSGQKISMLGHLNRTLKECTPQHISQILENLNDAMWTQETDLQIAAPPALIGILTQLSEAQVILLITGTRTMLEVKTETIRREWAALALESSAFLSPPALVRELVPLALKKTEHTEPHDQRIFGCTLIGRLCRRLDSDVVVNQMLRRAMSLCQDTDTNVRVTMCAQLAEVARAIGLQLTKERITRELFELLVDEEKLVSRAAFTALIDLVEFFDAPYRREHFYPIIKSYINSPPEEVLSLLIEEFGRFLWKIKSDIQSQEDVTLFANFFRQSAQKPDPDVRRMCAFNLPAVVASLPLSVYPTSLAQTTRALAMDSNSQVRRAIAAGIHELSTLLGDKAAFFLKDPFLCLIQDPALEVRSLVMTNLSALLDMFAAQLRAEDREGFFNTAVAPQLVAYEATIRKDWRKVTSFFSHFSRFPGYFSGAVIHDKLLPLLYHHLVNGIAAVKDQCASLVALFSRSLLKTSTAYVVETFSKIVSEFAKSPVCFHRSTFCFLFKYLAGLYSRRFVKDRLLECLLDLSKDPVVNVRIQLVRVLPNARRVLKAPMEAEYINQYNQALRRLQADPDPDVQTELRQVVPSIEQIEREFTQQQALRQANTPDDVNDKQLDEQEGNLLEVAKEQETLERRAKLRELLRVDLNPNALGGADAGNASKRPVPKRSPSNTKVDVTTAGRIRGSSVTGSTSASAASGASSSARPPGIPSATRGTGGTTSLPAIGRGR